MGFLAGRISFERYRIDSKQAVRFGDEHIETLQKHAIGQVAAASPDEPSVGFLAGRHIFDEEFTPEKNLLGDVLHCAARIDTNKVPSVLKKAWLEIELAAIVAEAASDKPNRAQKKEAKEAVEARCEDEARTGKYRRMQQFPMLWDGRDSVLYSGCSSPTAGGQCVGLMEQAFDLSFEKITAGRLAEQWATSNKKRNVLNELAPSVFHDEQSETQIAWLSGGGSENYDFLGNEFLVWLWWTLETKSDAIELSDGSEVVVMLNRTLSLECPQSVSGKEAITAEAPVRLPEATHAIRSGKLPRKTGLLLVRDGVQHEFVLQAETFAVSGAKVQLAESGNTAGSGEEEDRVEALRHLAQTLDLLFFAFCERRLGKSWDSELSQIRRWIKKDAAAKKDAA